MRYVALDVPLVDEVRQQILAAAVVHVLEAQSSESLQQDICSEECMSAGRMVAQACWPGSFKLSVQLPGELGVEQGSLAQDGSTVLLRTMHDRQHHLGWAPTDWEMVGCLSPI